MNLNNSYMASHSAASPSNVITAQVYTESVDRSSRPTTDAMKTSATGCSAAEAEEAEAVAVTAAAKEEHTQNHAHEIAQALLPVALRSHLKESNYWSFAIPSSCDEDEEHGVTTSVSSSTSGLQRR